MALGSDLHLIGILSLGVFMNYFWIFVVSYAVVCFAYFWAEVRRMRSRRFGPIGTRESLRTVAFTILTFVWGTFFTGSIVGGVAAGGYWAIADMIR